MRKRPGLFKLRHLNLKTVYVMRISTVHIHTWRLWRHHENMTEKNVHQSKRDNYISQSCFRSYLDSCHTITVLGKKWSCHKTEAMIVRLSASSANMGLKRTFWFNIARYKIMKKVFNMIMLHGEFPGKFLMKFCILLRNINSPSLKLLRLSIRSFFNYRFWWDEMLRFKKCVNQSTFFQC